MAHGYRKMLRVFSTGPGKDTYSVDSTRSLLIILVSVSMIGYPNYEFYFPIRALGKYEQDYLPWLKSYKLSANEKC